MKTLARCCISAFALGLLSNVSTYAADNITGQVVGAGVPIIGSTVTLWAEGPSAPRQLAQTRTGADGRFALTADASGANLYLVAKGGRPSANAAGGENPAIALLAVLGNTAPANVVVNEMTTIASVWTHAQFFDGDAIKGNALGLKIAAGNVLTFVNLETGGWGDAILGPLNSGQTPTMANFATLADALSGCVVRVVNDACAKLFAAATPPKGNVPTDTLSAAQSIARYPWYQPERVFRLLDEFYPVPAGKTLRSVPFMPYLKFPPSAWVLPLKFDGGGYRAGGKAMFDSEGNLWVGDNFTIGWQGAGYALAGQRDQVQPERKTDIPNAYRFRWWRHAGRHFRFGN